MLDELVRDLEKAVRELYPAARSFSASLAMSRYKPDKALVLDGVHVGFFVEKEQFSFGMYGKKDYVTALKGELSPSFDPILMGA